MVRYRFVAADTPALRRLPFARMKAEGLDRIVLWNRAAPGLEDWLDCVDPARGLCWLAYAPAGTLAGAVWLNPVMGLCGCVHFCVFRAARREWEPLGRQAVGHLFAALPLAALVAIWPACYLPVTRAARVWGFGAPVRLPRACHMPTPRDPARCRDGLLAVLRREESAAFAHAVSSAGRPAGQQEKEH